MTNLEGYGKIPLNDIMGTVYFHDCLKGFNKGFEAWLAYPYFEHKTRIVDGRLMLQNGIEYKGYLYTRDEFEAYKRDGMLP